MDFAAQTVERADEQSAVALAVVQADAETLALFFSGSLSVPRALEEGVLEVTGDLEAFAALFGDL